MLTLLALLVSAALASDYDARLVRVYDGDTIVAEIDVWPRLTATVSIRLRGVQAPELGWRAASECEREAGIEARQFVVNTLPAAFRVQEVEEGTYPGRVIAGILIDGVSLADLLLSHGHAVPYDGQAKAPRWVC